MLFLLAFFYFYLSFPNTPREKEVTVKEFKINSFLEGKKIYLIFLLLILPNILDLGPSNQWEVVFSNKDAFINGYIWILISLVGILANYIVGKVKSNLSFKLEFNIYLVLDIFIILTMVYSPFKLIAFLAHVFCMTILTIKSRVYLHREVIKDDSKRTMQISAFNTFESLVMTSLLPINGYLSEKFDIDTSWLIMVVITIFIWLVVKVINLLIKVEVVEKKVVV